jgi:rhamnose utilization protein RhaD (predicted bifunctional aldolase and dehydrogenase)/NAD(P)-dependent dehydrogenase (short-subunit alcohol dehydrogenase family)
MVQNQFCDSDAREFVASYPQAIGEDVAMRLFTSRLLGGDKNLVLHGGGNTSVKTTVVDRFGNDLAVICVKGSGCDLQYLEPAGLPALALAPLLELLKLDSIGDEDLVSELRRCLLDSRAPNPSVETLLHAAIPHKFVDHTHADAILALSNQPEGSACIKAAFGDRVTVLEYVQPGFPLAKAVADAFEADSSVEGIVLRHHGLFTFGDDAKSSYDRMIDLVAVAEEFTSQHIAQRTGEVTRLAEGADVDRAQVSATAAQVIPVVRGAFAIPQGEAEYCRMICSWRSDDDLVKISSHAECARLVAMGPLTPDHVIRTSGSYLYLTQSEATDPAACRRAVAAFVGRYQAYFDAHKSRSPVEPAILDGYPRVAVVEGLGVLAFGETYQAATIAGDIAEQTLRGKATAEAFGCFAGLPPAQLYDMEYWPLERAKLGQRRAATLQGQIALVTGGAGAIGYGVCQSLCAAGAVVVVADLNQVAAQGVADRLSEEYPDAALLAVAMDVTDPDSVQSGMDQVVLAFGGVDVVVPNAGIAHVSSLRDMGSEDFKRVIDVNLFGTMTILQAAAKLFEAQDTRGSIVVQASKNVFSPGASFGAYSASKAGQHQLGKIAALELAPLGVRVNMVNADAVFGDQVRSGLWEEVGPDRMKSRGLDEQGLKDFYRDRSLLKVTVTPRHVGDAVVFLASDAASATTGMTFTVDGGVAAAFPR